MEEIQKENDKDVLEEKSNALSTKRLPLHASTWTARPGWHALFPFQSRPPGWHSTRVQAYSH